MTVDKPVYHFHMFGKALTLDGAEAVQAVYGEWTRTGECVFYTDDDEKLAVSDNMVVSTSTMDQLVTSSPRTACPSIPRVPARAFRRA